MMSSQSRLLESAVSAWSRHGIGSICEHLLLGKGAVQEPSDDGQVATLVVGWENDRVFVLGDWRHSDWKPEKEWKKRILELSLWWFGLRRGDQLLKECRGMLHWQCGWTC